MVRTLISKNMTKEYTISEAKSQLTRLLREAEQGTRVRLTRRGKLVGVILGAREYARLEQASPSFNEAFKAFKKKQGIQGIEIDPRYFAGLRDPSPGRNVKL